jgi:hypothetical protein
MHETAHATDEDHGADHRTVPHAAPHSDSARIDGPRVDAAHGDHAQGAPLGPVDWAAWGAGILGIAAGLVIAACLYLSTTP